MPKQRCIWSHRHDPGTRPIRLKPGERYAEETTWICPAHEAQFRRFYAYAARYQNTFLALIGLIVVAGFALVLFESPTGVGLLLMGIGVVMLIFPFATPQTVQMLGLHASIWLVRIGGALMVGSGLYVLARGSG